MKPKSIEISNKLSYPPRVETKSVLSQIEHPIFCLHYLDKDYCLTKCNQEERAAFASTIRVLSTYSWNQIITNRIQDYEKLTDKSKIKNGHIPASVPKDASIIGFRFSGKKRMVGYRKDCVFHIIWFDIKFKLYDHGD